MKKSIFVFMSFLLLLLMLCVCCLVGCADNGSSLQYVNLDECEIGDEIPVHPDCEFIYALSDSESVTIDKFSATLVQKNVLNPGDTIDSTYYPYTIEVSAHGVASKDLIGEKIYFNYKRGPEENVQTHYISSTVDDAGEIVWNGSFRTYDNYIFGIYFMYLD